MYFRLSFNSQGKDFHNCHVFYEKTFLYVYLFSIFFPESCVHHLFASFLYLLFFPQANYAQGNHVTKDTSE